jgi:hypothetical protein
MDSNDGWVLLIAHVKYAWVCVANAETEISKGMFEHIIPLSPSLFEPVEGLLEVFDSVIFFFVIAGRILHVNVFVFAPACH